MRNKIRHVRWGRNLYRVFQSDTRAAAITLVDEDYGIISVVASCIAAGVVRRETFGVGHLGLLHLRR